LADVAGKETTCCGSTAFDFERTYIYGPENADLRVDGSDARGRATTNLYRMDSTVDGNRSAGPIRTWERSCRRCWSVRASAKIAETVDIAAVEKLLPDVEACARELRATKRNTVKAQPRHDIFEAATSDSGSKSAAGDGRWRPRDPCAGDIGGTPGKKYTGRKPSSCL